MSIGLNPTGTHLTLAGLGFQVATLTLFLCLAVDYAVIYWRKHGNEIRDINLRPRGPWATVTVASPESATVGSRDIYDSQEETNAADKDSTHNLEPTDFDGDGHKHHQHRPLSNRQFQIFLVFLTLSTVLILIRCCYRIAELRAGYFGHLFHDETLFIALESVYVCEHDSPARPPLSRQTSAPVEFEVG